MIAKIRFLWRSRWNLLRLALSAALLWAMIVDSGARLAIARLDRLPDHDWASEVRGLRESGRLGEALVLGEQAMVDAAPAQRAAIETEIQKTRSEQQSWLRRATDLGAGALTGAGEGQSFERLIGAVAADFFVVGDVRDLVIQGARFARDGEADGVIVALSAVGLATTLAPEIDWAPSLLKAARRAGAMSEKLASCVKDSVKARRFGEMRTLFADMSSISRVASPAGAVRLARLADEPADLARLARFLDKHGRAGAAALHATGRPGADALKTANALGSAGKLDQAARLEGLVVRAARKGEGGGRWLASGAPRLLLKPHPIVGLAKAVWKGHAAELMERGLRALDPWAWLIVPALAAWLMFEIGVFLLRATRGREVPARDDGSAWRAATTSAPRA